MPRADRRAKARAEEKKRKGRRGGPTRRVTRIVAGIVLAVVVLGAGGWGLYSYFSSPLASRRVVLVVNGREVTESDVARRENVIRYLTGLASLDAETKEMIFDSLIQDYLVAEEAARRGLAAGREELEEAAALYEDSLKVLYKSTLNITAQRLRLRVSASDLEEYIRAQILRSKLYEAVTAEVTIIEADVQALYEEYKEALEGSGLSYEDLKDRLAEEALNKKKGETYTQFLDELKAEATISTPD